jgi:hypothetical protein
MDRIGQPEIDNETFANVSSFGSPWFAARRFTNDLQLQRVALFRQAQCAVCQPQAIDERC